MIQPLGQTRTHVAPDGHVTAPLPGRRDACGIADVPIGVVTVTVATAHALAVLTA